MEKLIAYSRQLANEAKAIRDETSDDARQTLPITDRPESWWPRPHSDEFCAELNTAVETLLAVSRAIREKGYSRNTASGEQVESYTPNDFQDAILRVERLLP